MIKQYIYGNVNGSRRKIGVLIGIFADGDIQIGWSKCAKGDTFDKELGDRIALDRAEGGTLRHLPFKFHEEVERFANRCMRYFKHDQAVCYQGPLSETNLFFTMAKPN